MRGEIMEEIWKDVIGYEGYYEVSNLGRVRSVDREIKKKNCVQNKKGIIKTLYENRDGYLTVKLSKDGVDKREFVGRVVAKSFIPMPESDSFLEVNHKDFNRKNNCVENLEWVTHEENVRYSSNAGRHVSLKGENNPNYNNHFLSEYYAEHPEEKIKLSRPGKQNGRAVPVIAILKDGTEMRFDYLRECANYLIDNEMTRIKKLDGMANKISYCLKTGEDYMGIFFKNI